MLCVAIVVLAEILFEVFAGHPRNRVASAPRSRVGFRIVDGRFVLQRVVVGPRDVFDDVERVGVREAGASEPELLIEADRVDDERVAVPLAGRIAEVAGSSDRRPSGEGGRPCR